MVEPARVGDNLVLMTANGRERHVVDAVARVVSHAMDVPGEHRRDVACFDEHLVDDLPRIAVVAAKPSRMVQEEEDMLGVLALFEHLPQPSELLGTHLLALGLADAPLVRDGVAFVGVEHNEEAVLVLERVPQRAEVHLVIELVLVVRPSFAAVVHVVIARDGEPRADERVHHVLELAHLRHPLVGRVVAVDQVADRHHEVGLEQVRVADRVLQDVDARVRPARAVAVDHERECVRFTRQRQDDVGRSVREEPALIIGNRVIWIVRMQVASVRWCCVLVLDFLCSGARDRECQNQRGQRNNTSCMHCGSPVQVAWQAGQCTRRESRLHRPGRESMCRFSQQPKHRTDQHSTGQKAALPTRAR